MGTTSAYAWADKLLNGKLADVLRQYQADGLKADQIAIELREHDVIVSRETVRRWLLGLDPAPEAAAQ